LTDAQSRRRRWIKCPQPVHDDERPAIATGFLGGRKRHRSRPFPAVRQVLNERSAAESSGEFARQSAGKVRPSGLFGPNLLAEGVDGFALA
jgi:hypothetical protein